MSDFMETKLLIIGESTVTVGQLLSVLAFLVLGTYFIIWSAKFLRKRMASRRVNPDIVQAVSRAYLILGLLILAFMVLDILQVPLAAFAFISGAVAIGVGFGAQNIINNFISGWILMWERPIKIGDFLELGEVKGTVESIDTRSTRIRRVDGVHLLVPNSQLLENTVTNWTLVDNLVRTSVRVGVAYGSDVLLVTRLLNEVAASQADVLLEPAHTVTFEDFGDSSLVFELNVWVHSKADRGLRMIRSDIRYAIDKSFRHEEVVIAFPQRDVHVDGQIFVRSES